MEFGNDKNKRYPEYHWTKTKMGLVFEHMATCFVVFISSVTGWIHARFAVLTAPTADVGAVGLVFELIQTFSPWRQSDVTHMLSSK